MVDSPFPVVGTITATEYGHSLNVPCVSEWLSEASYGDYTQYAADRAARKYGEGVEVRTQWTGTQGECTGFELLDPVDG